MAKIGRRLETAVPRSNQQLETADHVAKRTRCAVIPIHDALGGIATTQEEQANGISVGLAAFRRDFREKASGTGGDGKTRFRLRGCEQHLDALFEGRAFICFVRKLAGQDEQDFLDAGERGTSQLHVRTGGRVERGRKNSQSSRTSRGATEEIKAHATVVVH